MSGEYCRNSVAADRVSSSSRTRTLPSRPSTGLSGQVAAPRHSTSKISSSGSGSMLNIANGKVTKVVTRPGHEDIFYSSDSELGGGQQKVRLVGFQSFNFNSMSRV